MVIFNINVTVIQLRDTGAIDDASFFTYSLQTAVSVTPAVKM